MLHAKCASCQHEQRHDIESELADGARLRATARKFKISYDSLWRHWRRHVSVEEKDRLRFGDAPAHRLKGMVAEEGISVLRDLNYARNSLLESLAVAQPQDAHARATLTGRLHENARIRGAVTGELAKSPLVTNTNVLIMNSAPMVELQAMLVQRLRPFPEAAKAVLEGLRQLTERDQPPALPALEMQQ